MGKITVISKSGDNDYKTGRKYQLNSKSKESICFFKKAKHAGHPIAKKALVLSVYMRMQEDASSNQYYSTAQGITNIKNMNNEIEALEEKYYGNSLKLSQ